MMELNAKKTKEMWIYRGKSIPHAPAPLRLSNTTLERVSEFKLLGRSVGTK